MTTTETTVAWGEAGLEQSIFQPSIEEGLLEKFNKELNQLQRSIAKPQSKNKWWKLQGQHNKEGNATPKKYLWTW